MPLFIPSRNRTSHHLLYSFIIQKLNSVVSKAHKYTLKWNLIKLNKIKENFCFGKKLYALFVKMEHFLQTNAMRVKID